MTKIIDIEQRLKLEQKKKVKIDREKKLEVVRKFMQCKRCMARCAMCGVQFDTKELYKRHPGPHRLCTACEEDYKEFQAITETGGDSPLYWHNREWLVLWQAWLDYQKAIKDYTESPEFIELLREVGWH